MRHTHIYIMCMYIYIILDLMMYKCVQVLSVVWCRLSPPMPIASRFNRHDKDPISKQYPWTFEDIHSHLDAMLYL